MNFHILLSKISIAHNRLWIKSFIHIDAIAKSYQRICGFINKLTNAVQ